MKGYRKGSSYFNHGNKTYQIIKKKTGLQSSLVGVTSSSYSILYSADGSIAFHYILKFSMSLKDDAQKAPFKIVAGNLWNFFDRGSKMGIMMMPSSLKQNHKKCLTQKKMSPWTVWSQTPLLNCNSKPRQSPKQLTIASKPSLFAFTQPPSDIRLELDWKHSYFTNGSEHEILNIT